MNTHPLVGMAMNAEDFPSFNTEILSTMKFIAENFDTIKSMPKQSDIIKIKSTKKRAAKDESTKNQKKSKQKTIYVKSDSDIEDDIIQDVTRAASRQDIVPMKNMVTKFTFVKVEDEKDLLSKESFLVDEAIDLDRMEQKSKNSYSSRAIIFYLARSAAVDTLISLNTGSDVFNTMKTMVQKWNVLVYDRSKKSERIELAAFTSTLNRVASYGKKLVVLLKFFGLSRSAMIRYANSQKTATVLYSYDVTAISPDFLFKIKRAMIFNDQNLPTSAATPAVAVSVTLTPDVGSASAALDPTTTVSPAVDVVLTPRPAVSPAAAAAAAARARARADVLPLASAAAPLAAAAAPPAATACGGLRE